MMLETIVFRPGALYKNDGPQTDVGFKRNTTPSVEVAFFCDTRGVDVRPETILRSKFTESRGIKLSNARLLQTNDLCTIK